MPDQAYKRCTKCGDEKPLTEFHRCRREPDGHQSRCKLCKLAENDAWRAQNRELAHEACRAWRTQNAERIAAYGSKHRDKFPTKRRARGLVQLAVQDGRLIKPERCEDCGKPVEARFLDGHHPDYSRPLEVEWLCRRCHGTRHITKPVAIQSRS